MKPLILVTAPVGTRSGYGSRSRDIVRALVKLDKYDVKVFNVPWGNTPQNALMIGHPKDKPIIDNLLVNPNLDRQPDIHIHIVVPNEFQPYGKFNIGITAGLEATLIPKEWIEGCNRMDLVLASSNFSKEVLLKTVYEEKNQQGQVVNTLQVNSPIEVLFEGVDTTIYKKTNEFSKMLQAEMNKVEETFNFLFVGHWLQGSLGNDRKDTGMLIKVFLETFKNQKKKPGLILKTSGAGFSVLDREDILGKIESIKQTVDGDLPNIYLMHGDFYDDEINELMNHPKVKTHINITHGEGFGRPLLEASMTEKPIIASSGTFVGELVLKQSFVTIKAQSNNSIVQPDHKSSTTPQNYLGYWWSKAHRLCFLLNLSSQCMNYRLKKSKRLQTKTVFLQIQLGQEWVEFTRNNGLQAYSSAKTAE